MVCDGEFSLTNGSYNSIPWIIVFVCSPLALLSLVAIFIGFWEQRRGTFFCSPCFMFMTHALGGVIWLLVLGLTAYLVSCNQLVMIVFLVFSAFALLSHATLAAHCLRCLRESLSRPDLPHQQLLSPQEAQTTTAGARQERSTRDDKAQPLQQPFGNPTLGIIPGTSNSGYMLWLPAESQVPWQQQQLQRQQQQQQLVPSNQPTSS
ncbi:hypothetical protein CEUSTIGMA_g11098.t1 [Chlamydomonas eustigma]|uniref:Uncharacterized protein n=1 Tax=Chlamydomonas eustigma TaxID=1157962 RepID=A0A250XKW8_9CHLO|nr:hypothetical protein CEUSTIGMA_g11098.t1 [Chlamydomonas eustigma]|eukprot:GAX83673.1 hypothetical protein CEUSTIGMA_g11098.t1 [Chlamydomonas eustigma]